MKSRIHQDFPEVKGKTVEMVEISAGSDYYGVIIRFQDNTSLSFAIEPSVTTVATVPVYSQWTDGNEKVLKEYEPVRSETAQG
jgi:hypothetical protein